MSQEVCTQSQQFLNELFQTVGFALNAEAETAEHGCNVNVTGEDTHLLLNAGGELLDALQYVLMQIHAPALDRDARITLDAENFRATRELELKAMARFAADRVRQSGMSFTFGALTSYERRQIHTYLAAEKDLHTESVGEGTSRRLQVSPK